MSENSEKKALIDFPCHFPIKIMGKNEPSFVGEMMEILCRHDANFDAENIKIQPSAKGNYLSITADIYTTDQEHLDNVYRALTAHEKTKYVL